MTESGERRPSLPTRIIESTRKVIKQKPIVLAEIPATGVAGIATVVGAYEGDMAMTVVSAGLTYLYTRMAARDIKAGFTEKNESESKKNKEINYKGIAEFLRRNKIANYPADLLTRILYHFAIKDPELRAYLQDKEAIAGMLEDSIISHRLLLPDEDEGLFFYEPKAPGHWVGYDFRRVDEFGPIVKEKGSDFLEGRLMAAPLFEIIDNPPEQHTPTDLLDVFKLEHMFSMEYPTIGELIEYGFVRETSYEEAYGKVGLYETYKDDLGKTEIKGEKLYRITPKGNGLIELVGDSGHQDEQRKDEKEAKRVLRPGWIPFPA